MTVPSRSCETSEPFLVSYTIPVSDLCFRLLNKRSVGVYLRLIEHTLWPNPLLRVDCRPLCRAVTRSVVRL